MAKYTSVDELLKIENYVEFKENRDMIYDFYNTTIDRLNQDYDDDCIIDWIIENIKGKWSDCGIGDYYFENEADAIACKMRWL